MFDKFISCGRLFGAIVIVVEGYEPVSLAI